jgi:hypothetical protein
MTIPTFDNCLYSSCMKVHIGVHFDHVPCNGNMRFFRPIPEPQVTEPELLQENKNDIVGNKILHCGKSYSYHILIRDAMTIPTFDNCLYSSCMKVQIGVHFDHVPCNIC